MNELQPVSVETAKPKRRGKRPASAAVSKSMRFEVFKRDSFTCQYCGRKAPEVVLHADHVVAVANGGSTTLMNLITACGDCNLGKSDRRLDDQSALAKQQRQLEQLQERREQLELMMRWQQELLLLETVATDEAANYWEQLVAPLYLTEVGRSNLEKLLRKFPLDRLLEAMRIAVSEYVERVEGSPTKDSLEHAWTMVGRIASVRVQLEREPYLKDLFYIRGIIKNRFAHIVPHRSLAMLKEAYAAGASIESLKDLAREATSWSGWQHDMEEHIEGLLATPSERAT